jgi:hypothetical protein
MHGTNPGRTIVRLVVVVALTVVGLAASAPVSGADPAITVRVDGLYRIVSTDCYFARGSCHHRFDIVQAGSTLRDPDDSLFHGAVHGDQVRVGERFPPGTSEDSWTATGTTTDGGRTIRGTMVDGIGGSGTFTMTLLHA